MNLKTVRQLGCARCIDSHALINTSVGDLSPLNVQNLPSVQKSGAGSPAKGPVVLVPRDSCKIKENMEKLPKILPLQAKGPVSLQTCHPSFQIHTIYKPISILIMIKNNFENEEIGKICAKY